MLAPSESWPSHLPPANPAENPFSRRINQPELVSIPFDTPVRWQLGVDLTYRGLICDLMEVNDFGATSDRASFLHTIRTLDPGVTVPGSGMQQSSGVLLASTNSSRRIFRCLSN